MNFKGNSMLKPPKEKRERQPNWTESEKQFLISLTKRHQTILENKGSDSSTLKRKSAAWDDIASHMKAAGFHRSKERLKQQWGRIKSAESKKAKNVLVKNAVNGSTFVERYPIECGQMYDPYGLDEKNIKMNGEFYEMNTKSYANIDDMCIKIERCTSIDEFANPIVYDSSLLVAPEAPVIESKEEVKKDETDECIAKKVDNNLSNMPQDSCSKRRKVPKRREQRLRQLHAFRIAIEREKLRSLRAQRKRDDLLYEKDLQIQNLKMQILQNLISQNRDNYANICESGI